jgi:hypothetical protein
MDNKKYKQLREAIIKVVPDIVKPTFGCKTSRGKIVAVFESQGYYKYAVDYISAHWPDTTAKGNLYTIQQLGGIIGRDITLADCLLAINSKKGIFKSNYGILSVNNFIEDLLQDWNLQKNTLNDQSDETKESLFNLICEK